MPLLRRRTNFQMSNLLKFADRDERCYDNRATPSLNLSGLSAYEAYYVSVAIVQRNDQLD